MSESFQIKLLTYARDYSDIRSEGSLRRSPESSCRCRGSRKCFPRAKPVCVCTCGLVCMCWVCASCICMLFRWCALHCLLSTLHIRNHTPTYQPEVATKPAEPLTNSRSKNKVHTWHPMACGGRKACRLHATQHLSVPQRGDSTPHHESHTHEDELVARLLPGGFRQDRVREVDLLGLDLGLALHKTHAQSYRLAPP